MNVSQALVTAAQHSADLQGDTSQTKGWEENAALAAEIGNADSVRAREKLLGSSLCVADQGEGCSPRQSSLFHQLLFLDAL